MNPNSSSAALLNVGVLIALCALAYFVFPGQDGIMIAIGLVVGFVLAMLTFARTMPAGATIPAALGAFVGLVLVAFAIPWMISHELRAADVGNMRDGLLTMSGAVGALLWGVALRLLWNSRKLIR
ncbi:hypothetical protein [Sphingomonas bacterium]|uniref:hypothetical protein n=1 Tax=Sphingomonas bacterium TaxID=1895847 RepID=UPI002607845E|nr:hypothetical protein [Sphingomonas bacterium]MDB5677836.1 hypothetical protein [Sphingomonas bacterium]